MSLVRRVTHPRPALALAALAGVLVVGCANRPYSQIAAPTSAAVTSATPSGSASPGPSSSGSPSGSAFVPPPTAVSGEADLKSAKDFTLPSTVGDYKLSTDPQLDGIYQKKSSATDIYTAQVTAVSVDAGEIAKSLFTAGVQKISDSYCGQLKSQPAVCIRQLNGGYLQVTGSGSKSVRDVAAFAASLYGAA